MVAKQYNASNDQQAKQLTNRINLDLYL